MIAESVVKDHCSSLTEVRGDVMPGLFFLPGELSVTEIKKDYAAHLNRAKIKQKEWFSALISLADALWARSNGNPMVVSSDMKLAARELNMEDNKEWCKNQIRAELIRCIACGTMLNSTVVVCPSCKVIVNEGKAKELGLKFAS
jgi:hypothetical protein